MLPIGLLMREHRLIERMVNLAEKELRRISEQTDPNLSFLGAAVDFFRTYADRCHHGKEEDILFRDLAKKELSQEHKKIVSELMEEHVYARKTVGRLEDATRRHAQGRPEASNDIKISLNELAKLYPVHIEKEDRHFFYPSMEYFTKQELNAMLHEFLEFDRKLVHTQYEGIVNSFNEAVIEIQKPRQQLSEWRCIVCGYIYDPEKGDPEYGIEPGIPFEELASDWLCPICLAPKADFEKL